MSKYIDDTVWAMYIAECNSKRSWTFIMSVCVLVCLCVSVCVCLCVCVCVSVHLFNYSMKLFASNSDKIASLIQIKGDSIKISRKAIIIQQKYQIRKKP